MLAGPGVPEKRREVVGLVVCFLSLGVIFCIGNIYAGSLVGGWTIPIEKYISQIGNLPQIGVKIKNNWSHHLDQHLLGISGQQSKLRKQAPTTDSTFYQWDSSPVAKLSRKKHASRLVGNGRKMGGQKSHFSHHDVGIQVSNSRKI